MTLLYAVLLAISLSGCTIGYAMHPVDPPLDTGLRYGEQPGHMIAKGGPRIADQEEFLGIYRKTSWDSPAGTFTSYVLCPLGLPRPGEHARCFQNYGGIKCDWTETVLLQRLLRGWYDYVFTASEQFSLRFTTISYPTASNMGGS